MTPFQFHANLQAARIHVLTFTPLRRSRGRAGAGVAERLKSATAAVIVAITVAYLIFHPSTRYRDPATFSCLRYALGESVEHATPRWYRAVDAEPARRPLRARAAL